MATDVVMPQMGESIFEGTITKWLRKVGDHVEKDEPLFEISTDKVDAEIPAPVSGLLSEVRFSEGQTLAVNTVVAVIGGEVVAPAPAPEPASLPEPESSPRPETAEPAAPIVRPGGRLRSSPLVRRIAKENSIDLNFVPGTGAGGRITKADVLTYLEAPRPTAAPADRQVVPLTRMRAIIAERMLESKRISPHVHTVYKIDMTRVVRMRERAKAGFEKRHAVKLTYLPFVASAVVASLKKFPIVNASLVDNSIHYHADVNLGIAVALEWGLIVPVIRQAQQSTFAGVARSIADLASRARSKKLSPDEIGGSTFTLTNSGIFGDEFSLPIINQPESAILCISALKKEPVVLTDAEGNDTIAIRSMQHFTLGFDHRLIDGADACGFMLEFKRILEDWDSEIA